MKNIRHAIIYIIVLAIVFVPTATAGQYGIHIIFPETYQTKQNFIAITLPVTAGSEYASNFTTEYGNFLKLIDENNLATRFNCTFVYLQYPWNDENEISSDPWYVDSKGNSSVSQESFVMDVVAKLDLMYPNSQKYLLGYSKSGFGALHLLFKYPESFSGCAIFDAPLGKSGNTMFKYPGARHAFSSYSAQEFDHFFNLNNRIKSYAEGHSQHLIWLGIKNAHFKGEMTRFAESMRNSGIDIQIKSYQADMPHSWNLTWIEDALTSFKEDSDDELTH